MITLAQADLGALKADFVKSMIVFGISMLVVTSGMVLAIFAWLSYRLEKKAKKDEAKRAAEPQPSIISPQPLLIEFAKKFAEKHEFETQQKHCTKRHSELFNKMDKVEKDATAEMSTLSRQITALQTETKMQSHQLKKLDTMERELRDMPGKIVVDILNAQKLGRKND